MLAGKSVVVTGAGSGIGRVLALKLAALNADVWAADIATDSLASLAEEAEKLGHSLHVNVLDVVDADALARLRDAVLAERRSLDFWVNNAGIAGLGAFLDTTPADFFKVLDVNLKGLVNGTRVALEAMEKAGAGTIVNMASVAGHLPAPFMTAYNASKHGVVGFTRSLQSELKLKGSVVKIMMVSPGFVDTKIIARGEKLGFPESLSFLLATAESVADAVVKGMLSHRDEIYPTLNGKVMKGLYGWFPKTTVRSSRMLLAKNFRDILSNRQGE